MNSTRIWGAALGLVVVFSCSERSFARSLVDGLAVRPDAVIDLATEEGTTLAKAQWRYSDAKVEEIDSQGVGADLRATGAPNRTYDVTPHAGVANYDDSAWAKIEPAGLETRRSTGKVCFAWY